MESPDRIRQKCPISAYFRKQDQSTQRAYHLNPKILSIITSVSQPIKTTLKIEKHLTNVHRKTRVVNHETKEKKGIRLRKTLSLRDTILCSVQNISER